MKYATLKHRMHHKARARRALTRRQHMATLRRHFGPNWRDIMANGREASNRVESLRSPRAAAYTRLDYRDPAPKHGWAQGLAKFFLDRAGNLKALKP